MRFRQTARRAAWAVFLAALGVALSALWADTSTGYLARSAYFQAELLWGRVPLDEVDPSAFGEKERQRLADVPVIQAFGDEVGLSAPKSYRTINPTWDRTIYNVSACDPVSFRTVRWRFPIVGTVPYLGYFRIEDARHRARDLSARGLDVYVRTAGAYSTLGWFQDPLLPPMLKWDESELANTLLHERAHATLWIPGSVKFNESFAAFVGDEAELRYLIHRYGEDSEPVRKELARRADGRLWKGLQHDMYEALDALYRRKDLDRGAKLRDKALIFAALPTRVAESGFAEEARYVRAARTGPWNNARLAQFRTYHTAHEHFAVLLGQEDGDLVRFIARVDAITRGVDDPYDALAAAVGAEPDASDSD